MDKDLRNILFSKFETSQLSLKNRIVMNPVPTGFVESGVPKPEIAEFYKRRAKNVGLFIIGAINIEHETATNNENIPNISTSRDIEVWKQVTKAIHQEKSKAIAELWHSGSSRAFSKTDLSLKVSTPSGYIGKKKVGSPLSVEEINLIVQKFAEAARKAQISGFDGVDIHAAHGSLIHDFLTAETNQRTDEFGFKNRTYFAERVIKECRKVVGDNFPIFIRLSNFKSYDSTAKLAKTLEELKQIIIPISNAGVDIFDCSEINYTDSAVTGKSGNLAYWVKKITNRPTITTGGIGSPEILYKDIPTLITEITSQPKMSYLHLQRKKAQIFYSNNLVSDFKEGGFDLLAFGRPLLINENWFDEITEEV